MPNAMLTNFGRYYIVMKILTQQLEICTNYHVKIDWHFWKKKL